MKRVERILTAMATLALSACAISGLEMAPPAPDRPWSPKVSAGGEIVAGTPDTQDSSRYVLPANRTLATRPPAVTDQAKVYTLPTLIDLAESTQPTTRIAWNEARRAALAAGIAESAYLPQITASALAGRQNSHGHATADGIGIGSRGSASGTLSALSVQWLLFDFGERTAVVDAAKQASAISNIAFTAAHQQIIHAVSAAFYAHAAARGRQRTSLQSVQNARQVEDAAQARYRQGLGTVVELAQARQATAAAELAQVNADGSERDAYLALMNAVGLPPMDEIHLADVSARPLPSELRDSLDDRIASALSRRPDVLSAYAATKASAAKIRAARAEFMPKVFLSAVGAYGRGDLSVNTLPSAGPQPPAVNTSGHRFNSSVFLGVSVPLYDGGTRSAMLARARAEADSADATLNKVRDEAVRQVVAAENALRTALAAHDAAGKLVQAAQTTFDAALAAYRKGLGSITEVSLAENQLLLACNALGDAHSAALTAAATLALATGELGGPPP